jgi:hypothetical protein
MTTLSGWFALAYPLEPPVSEAQPAALLGLSIRDAVLIFGAAAVLALILFLWVYLTRRGRRGHSANRPSNAIYRPEKGATDPASRRVKVRRKRRRHPDNYPRNPTLGETGGLPPARSEDPPEPAH